MDDFNELDADSKSLLNDIASDLDSLAAPAPKEPKTDKPVADIVPITAVKRAYVARDDEDFSYDDIPVDDFLAAAFPSVPANEHVLGWIKHEGKGIGYPVTTPALLSEMTRIRTVASFYYGTSTVTLTESHQLRNRKAQFASWRVLVLDDIGTKIPLDKIPEGMTPTYIIESSVGNFQYGYVFDEPIRDLKVAEAMVKLFYSSGLTDSGGAIPNKIVRLPGGMNGKNTPDKRTFPVNLVSMEGPYWSPADLISYVTDTPWKDFKTKTAEVAKKLDRLNRGVSGWRGYDHAEIGGVDGVTDPIVEYLAGLDMIISEGAEWYTIECPWANEHTQDESDTFLDAYYSPLGIGPEPFTNTRGFNCFHEHCLDRTINDALQHWVSNGAPISSARNNMLTELIRDWVFDASSNKPWKIAGVPQPEATNFEGFKNTRNETLYVPVGDDKIKGYEAHALWRKSKDRKWTSGLVNDPGTRDAIVYDEYDNPKLNTYSRPDFGEGAIDMSVVQTFLDYVDYLIPDEYEREYFIDWLAAKYQNPKFRGAAVLMITPATGTGRNTLATIVEQLFGIHNTVTKKLHDVLTDPYDEWKLKSFVVVSETRATGSGDPSGYYSQYETIKELFELNPSWLEINPKYGSRYYTWVYTSYLMFSNNTQAVKIPDNDRRLFVCDNTRARADTEFYAAIKGKLAETEQLSKEIPRKVPKLAKHLARWLMQREPDMPKLVGIPKKTPAKQRMVDAGENEIEQLVSAILTSWPVMHLTKKQFSSVVDGLRGVLDSPDAAYFAKVVNGLFVEATVQMHGASNNRVKVGKGRPAIKLIHMHNSVTPDYLSRFTRKCLDAKERTAIGAELENLDIVAIIDAAKQNFEDY